MVLNKLTEKKVIYAVAINFGIYLLMRLFFYSTYESQLDVMALAGLSGVSGIRTAFILYSNVILGGFLKGLMSILPVLNWYYMYLSGSVMVALALVSYVILKRTPDKLGYTITVVLVCFVGYECYVLPGSMKTAAVLGVSALVILADYMEVGVYGKRKREYLIGVLAVLGSMTFFSVFWIVMVIGLVGILIYYMIQSGEEVRDWLKKENPARGKIRYAVLLMICIIAAAALLQAADTAIYHLDGQKNAAKYRSSMVRMYGYGMGKYDEAYQSIYGIDSTQYTALQNGSFGVAGEDSWERIDKISKEGREVSGEKINSYFKTVPVALFKYGIFYLFIIMLCMLFFSTMKKKKFLLWTELAQLLASCLIVYLFQAWGNNRVVFVLILPLIIPVLLSLKEAKAKEYKYLWAYLIVLSVILYSKFSPAMVSSVLSERMADKFSNLNANQVNMIDLNAYLKSFSASDIYVKGVLDTNGVLNTDSLQVSNGAYSLMKGFEDKEVNAYPAEGAQYQWIYNPYNLNEQSLKIIN